MTTCVITCLTEQCTAVEMLLDGSVCHIYRGSHLYRVPLTTNIISDQNYILYQEAGNVDLKKKNWDAFLTREPMENTDAQLAYYCPADN